MREYMMAAKAVRDIFTELQREIEGAGAVISTFDRNGEHVERHIRDIELDGEIDQLRVVIPVGGKVTGSHRIGELLAQFDRAHAVMETVS